MRVNSTWKAIGNILSTEYSSLLNDVSVLDRLRSRFATLTHQFKTQRVDKLVGIKPEAENQQHIEYYTAYYRSLICKLFFESDRGAGKILFSVNCFHMISSN